MEEKHFKVYASLLSGVLIKEAQIKAAPIPHLKRAANEISRLRNIIDRAEIALTGADDLDFAEANHPELPPSIVETIGYRNNEAHKILREKEQPQ